MSLIAEKVSIANPLAIAEMPPFFLWGKQSSIGIGPDDSFDVIQAKMSSAINSLAQRPVRNALQQEVSPETGHKPS